MADQHEVYEEVLDLAPQWKPFGGALGLDHRTVAYIESFHGDSRDHLEKVFVNIWLEILTVWYVLKAQVVFIRPPPFSARCSCIGIGHL